MRKKIVVTGSSGRIGGAIVESLRPTYEVVGIDRLPSPFTTYKGDILDPHFLGMVLNDAHAVIHAAAYHAPHVGRISDGEFQRVNVEGTKLIANLMREKKISKIIFTSTTALYGHASQAAGRATWIDENTLPRPKTIYHSTKVQAEDFLEEFARKTSTRVSVIRMSRCFPEPANLMVVYRLHRGVDCRDVAEAHKLALENDALPLFDKYIVSGKTPFARDDCRELMENPERVLEARCPEVLRELERLKIKHVPPIDRVYDSSKAQRELGWFPRYGYQEVIQQLRDGSPEILVPA